MTIYLSNTEYQFTLHSLMMLGIGRAYRMYLIILNARATGCDAASFIQLAAQIYDKLYTLWQPSDKQEQRMFVRQGEKE